MTDDDFIAEMRAKINPAYADHQGTESWERKLALAIIDGLLARLELSPEHPEQDGIYCRDETIRLQDAEIARLRAEREMMRSDMSALKPDPRCDISCMLICHGEAKYLRDAVDRILASTGTYYMDPPDGGDVSVSEQLVRLAQDARRYRFIRDSEDDEAIHDDCYRHMLTSESLDAAIDSAISEQALQALADEAQAMGLYDDPSDGKK